MKKRILILKMKIWIMTIPKIRINQKKHEKEKRIMMKTIYIMKKKKSERKIII